MTTVGRIPAALMTELIGVPHDMREQFIEHGVGPDACHHDRPEPGSRRRPSGSSRLVEEFHSYCGELLADRRANGAQGRRPRRASSLDPSTTAGPVPPGMAISFIHTFVERG